MNHQYSKSLAAERRLRAALAGPCPGSVLLPAAAAVGTADRRRVRPSRALPTRLHQLQRGFPAGRGPPDRALVRALPEVPLRLPRPGAVPAATAPGRDLRGRPVRGRRPVHGYRELLGLAGTKPFECVGEIEESQVALALVGVRGQWDDAGLVRGLLGELRSAGRAPGRPEIATAFAASSEHELPPRALAALEAALDSGLDSGLDAGLDTGPTRGSGRGRTGRAGPSAVRTAELAGRRVAVWGIGGEGRAAAVTARRAGAGDVVAVVDGDPPAPAIAAWSEAGLADVPVVTRGDGRTGAGTAALARADVVVMSPGVSLYRDEVRALVAGGVAVTSGTQLFLAEHGGRTWPSRAARASRP